MVRDWAKKWILTFFSLKFSKFLIFSKFLKFSNFLKFSGIFVFVPFCKLVKIRTLLSPPVQFWSYSCLRLNYFPPSVHSWVLGHISNMKNLFLTGLGSRASTVKKVWGGSGWKMSSQRWVGGQKEQIMST